MSDITDRIESLLVIRHMKRADLARATGIPEATMRNWIKGTSPQAVPLSKIAASLGVSLDYLVTGAELKIDSMSEEQERALELFTILDEADREEILALLEIKSRRYMVGTSLNVTGG